MANDKMSLPETQENQEIFNAFPKPCLTLSPGFNILSVNDAYIDVSFKKREEMIGRYLFDVFPDNPNDPNVTGQSNLTASLNKVLQEKTSDKMAIKKYSLRSKVIQRVEQHLPSAAGEERNHP